MRSKLSRFVMTGVLFLTACGFSPIYGSHGDKPAVTASLGAIAIDAIPDSNGQFLRNKLMDRLYTQGRPKAPKARLSVALRSSEDDLGIQKDATASRSRLTLWADYTLTDNDGNVLLKRTVRSIASYNKIDAQYGMVATQRNVYERTLNEVGEQIVNALSLYYAETTPSNSVPNKP